MKIINPLQKCVPKLVAMKSFLPFVFNSTLVVGFRGGEDIGMRESSCSCSCS